MIAGNASFDGSNIEVRRLGTIDYFEAFEAMRLFTEQRQAMTPDELWLLQHPPVYTLGMNGRREHILSSGAISVVPSDRGGQITYHGPGQLIVYTMIDLQRRGLGVRQLVTLLEESVIEVLAMHDVAAQRRTGAPGVYVAGRKIAALGLRVRRGCSYHGVALNVAMDLNPYSGINPCGYRGLQVTQTSDEGIDANLEELSDDLVAAMVRLLKERPTIARAVGQH